MKNLIALVLAAGKGVRMKSELPKVFHKILGEPMLTYVLEMVKKISPEKTYVVVGHKRELIMDHYKSWNITFVIQEEQMGTGHAVVQVEPYLEDFQGTVLILNGDVPLITEKTIYNLIHFHQHSHAVATVLTAELENPSHYGRIIRKPTGEVEKIVEQKDATGEELRVHEINTGTFCFEKKHLFEALAKVKPENIQKEYYLTDTLEILRKGNLPVFAFPAENPQETLGINTPEELATVERILLQRG